MPRIYRRFKVWRRSNERSAPDVLLNTVVMVGKILGYGLVLSEGWNGTLTTKPYCNEILDVYVRPNDDAIGPNFILMTTPQGPSHKRIPATIDNLRNGLACEVSRPQSL